MRPFALFALVAIPLVASPALAAGPLAVGDKAPDFTLADQHGQSVRLSEVLAKRRHVVLAFYVQAFTPGWVLEFSRFRDDKAKFDALEAEVIGISVDPPETNLAWTRDLGLPFHLLSDLGPKGEVGRRYGVYDPTWGLERRATFVIDRDRTIRFVEVDQLAVDIKPILEALDRLARAAR